MASGGRRKYFPTQLETFVQCPLKSHCSRDPEVRDKIFEPGVTSKTGGWGVGLALSRRIVQGVHKGHIELLEGTAGTTFQIRLPVADA